MVDDAKIFHELLVQT